MSTVSKHLYVQNAHMPWKIAKHICMQSAFKRIIPGLTESYYCWLEQVLMRGNINSMQKYNASRGSWTPLCVHLYAITVAQMRIIQFLVIFLWRNFKLYRASICRFTKFMSANYFSHKTRSSLLSFTTITFQGIRIWRRAKFIR